MSGGCTRSAEISAAAAQPADLKPRPTFGVGDQEDRVDVDRVLAGEREAFAGIVGRWQRPLVDLAWRLTGDRSRAEDLAQDAFLQAYRSLDRWRRESAFSTWLFAVALNVYRSRLRRLPLPVEDREPDTVAGPEADEHDALAQRVRRAVRALPEKYRDALTAFYFHDLDLRAAAASLRLSEGTLKAQLYRGRKLLERVLGAQPAREDR